MRFWKPGLAGLLVTGLCLAGAASVRSREDSFRREELERDTRIVARQAAVRIWGALERHRVALQQMANFYVNSEEVTWEEFFRFARLTQELSPLLVRISFINPTWRVGATYPRTFEPGLNQLDVRDHPDCYRTMLRARATRKAAASSAVDLPDGNRGFILAIPVFKGDDFQGEVVGAFHNEEFFESTLFPELLQRYSVRVLAAGKPLLAQDVNSPLPAGISTAVEKFSLGGTDWEAHFRPREPMLRGRLDSGKGVFWILASTLALLGGVLAAVLTRWTVIVASRVRTQNQTLQQTREQLDEAVGQLHQADKMRAMGELVAGVAHEINNPLSSILGYTQLLQGRELPEDVRRRLEVVHSEADRMARIVQNLLTFARKHPPEKKYLGLNGIIEKTLELKSYPFRLAQIRVERDLSPGLPRTMLDFTQIQQVLLNLFNNAEQAMLEAPGERILRISTREAEGQIQAQISDTGPGIPPQNQARIFEPFFTTKKEGKGTGLGLSLCYGIVQAHQGTIRVESGRGKGATFILSLPVRHPSPQENAPPDTDAPPREGRNILVIDPDPGLVSFLVDLLTSRGHRVDTASDMAEAIRKIGSNGHDLIIADARLPRGSGSQIREAVAAKNPHLARRIIFTSVEGNSEEALRLGREQGGEVLQKPFRIEEVERAIAGVLRN